jgi:hypothetical protein
MTDDTPKAYKSLEALVEENLEAIREGTLRPYKVTPQEGKSVYALSNSKGNAALAVCEVKTCDLKEIKTALINAMIEKAKTADA